MHLPTPTRVTPILHTATAAWVCWTSDPGELVRVESIDGRLVAVDCRRDLAQSLINEAIDQVEALLFAGPASPAAWDLSPVPPPSGGRPGHPFHQPGGSHEDPSPA